MRVRALKGFHHRVTGSVAEGAVLDIESRELAEALVADGWLTASKLPAETLVAAEPVVEATTTTATATAPRSRKAK